MLGVQSLEIFHVQMIVAPHLRSNNAMIARNDDFCFVSRGGGGHFDRQKSNIALSDDARVVAPKHPVLDSDDYIAFISDSAMHDSRCDGMRER
ncbi:MAG: hypothetical protein N2Z57_09570, partial [Oscillospiraceae bacterium]|nr:hypothetical protein [Oscillospiraceae bacterium]